MGELYDADVLEWSEHQARLLRQHAAGEPGNEAPDWTNIIEEVESVGRGQLTAVQSLLVQALRNVSTTLIQPGLEFRLGWSGRLCGIELSEAAGFLV